MASPDSSRPAELAGTPVASSPDARLRSAFLRYRVMAMVTGVMLLVLTLEMVLKYVFHAGGVGPEGEALPVLGSWIAILHGWVYVAYAVTAFDVWSKARWSLGRLAVMIAGGVVPVLSFVVEHAARSWLPGQVRGTAAPAA